MPDSYLFGVGLYTAGALLVGYANPGPNSFDMVAISLIALISSMAGATLFALVCRDFYTDVDDRIGRLMQHVEDDTAVIIVSDHGAKPMLGGICVNQWLIERGQLTVRDDLSKIKRIEDCDID